MVLSLWDLHIMLSFIFNIKLMLRKHKKVSIGLKFGILRFLIDVNCLCGRYLIILCHWTGFKILTYKCKVLCAKDVMKMRKIFSYAASMPFCWSSVEVDWSEYICYHQWSSWCQAIDEKVDSEWSYHFFQKASHHQFNCRHHVVPMEI